MIQNGSGTMIDYTTYIESVSPDEDIDRPVGGLEFALTMSQGSNQFVVRSLSPFRSDSVLNRLDDGVTYSPALDINRIVTFEVATTAPGASIVSGDWKLLFKGTIDIINFEQSPITVSCRDLGAPLVDRSIESEAPYGTALGRAIELVKQDILDTTLGAGVVPVNTPVSPGFNVVLYTQQKQSLSDAEQALDTLIGWDSRYWWDSASSTYKYTFQAPPRTKTTPDYTFGPQGYISVRALNIDLTDIRNAVQVSYQDRATLKRVTVTRTDSTSITKYGRRWFLIQEADNSPIDTSAEATALADAALSDLKEPKGTLEIELPFFWPVQLWDLFRFSANGKHFNSDQDLAVSTYTHKFSKHEHRTVLRLRGKPAGAYGNWLGKGQTDPFGQVKYPVPTIRHDAPESDNTQWGLIFNATPGSGGGGANLTYTISTKTNNGADTTLTSGDATSLPLSYSITRDQIYDKDCRFTVTDVATTVAIDVHTNIPHRGTYQISDPFLPQGSMPPTPVANTPFSYASGGPSSGAMWMTWTWAAITIRLSNNTNITTPASSALPTPPSPTLSQVASGALAARTRFVRIAYVKNQMLMHVGAENSLAISINNLLKVTSPASVTGYDGWVPLVGASTNTEFVQTSSPGGPANPVPFGTDWTEPAGGAVISGTTPYDNTNWPTGVTATGMVTSTTYYFYPWWELVNAFVVWADRGQTAKTDVAAQQQNLDGRIPLNSGAISGNTPAAAGSNSGTGGSGKYL